MRRSRKTLVTTLIVLLFGGAPAPSMALTLDQEAQLDDIEAALLDMEVSRDQDRLDRQRERAQDAEDHLIEQQRLRETRSNDQWMDRCLRFAECPVSPRPRPTTARAPFSPPTGLAAKSKAVRDYDEYVTRNMTAEQIAAYRVKAQHEEEAMLRNLRENKYLPR